MLLDMNTSKLILFYFYSRPVFPEDYTPPIGFIGGPDYHPNIKLMYHLFLRYTFYSEYKQGKKAKFF